MTCQIDHDHDGYPITFRCGPEPKPKDHDCDMAGGMRDIESSMGTVTSATCSICGRPAFNEWDIW